MLYHQIHDLLPLAKRDAILSETKEHQSKNTNFDMEKTIKGQNKVSENTTLAESEGWMQLGTVNINSINSEKAQQAKATGWVLDDNQVNTKFQKDAW
jgi:hypothetical protein